MDCLERRKWVLREVVYSWRFRQAVNRLSVSGSSFPFISYFQVLVERLNLNFRAFFCEERQGVEFQMGGGVWCWIYPSHVGRMQTKSFWCPDRISFMWPLAAMESCTQKQKETRVAP